MNSEAERARWFGKGYVEPRPQRYLEDTPLETTWDEVKEAAIWVELPHPLTRAHRVHTGVVPLEEKIELILTKLKDLSKVEFRELLAPWQEKIHGVMTLLAGLELSKQRAVTLRQSRLFSELWILKRDLEAWTGEVLDEEKIEPEEVE
jgi:chromatin segregation and condensation protein Rec8/ScpA/Scc1 (kleisin family)